MIPTFAANLAAGCGGSSPGANPDARPVTDDGPLPPPPDAGSEAGYCDPEIQECVDLGADVYVPPDTDGPVTRPDGRPDAGPDSGPDAGIPGVNYCAAELPGPVKALKSDPSTPSNVWAFTGPDGTTKPIKLSLCTPADPGFDCTLKADFTDPAATSRSVFAAGMVPVDFAPVPDNGFGFAVAAAPSGSPTTVVRVDQNAADFGEAVPSSRYYTTIEGAWGAYDATHPNSIITYRASSPSPAHFRSALTFAEGSIGIFVEDVNFSGEVTNPLRRSSSVPALSDDINSSSIAFTRLAIDGEETDALIVLNSGAADLATGASISYLDPWATELVAPLTDPADLGPGHAPILKLAEDGTTAYIAFGRPTASLLHYDMETQEEITTISLDGAVVGDVRAMDVSDERACIGDASGAVVFVNLTDNIEEGYLVWPALPESILWHGGRGAFLIGNENCIGEVNPPADALRRP